MLRNFKVKNNKLFIGGVSAESLVKKYGSSLYVYDAAIIKRQYKALVDNITYPNLKIHYACKTNSNLKIIKLLKKLGAAIETVSIGEVDLAFQAGFDSSDILYTSGNISYVEQLEVMEKKVLMNLDSLTQIKRFGEISPGGKISFRINQGIGAGFHKHTITGGSESKFGIDISQIGEVLQLVKRYHLQIIGIHQHIGSNILDENIFMQAIEKLLATAKQFTELEFIDFGGGFGVSYQPEEKPLDMQSLGSKISIALNTFTKEYGKELVIRFEPGRFLVAESGVLLAKVTEIKHTLYKTFVGINSGFNQLIRPAMYGAYQEIVNASRVNGEKEIVSVVGNICESADFFAKDRKIAKFEENDIVAILASGAYGYSMSSGFNSRSQPAEVLVTGKNSRLIREERGV
ncbi:diaminopimelate decarboxylase [Candidatus Roizmanbacteria bacterium]|nr:diaminopimelate decarboxylase [Candidatus Roizmanbacteria bacterium]